MKFILPRATLIAIAFFAAQNSAFAAPVSPVKVVLITGFEPFGGKSQNGSQLTAEAMLKLNSIGTGIHYRFCLLPVEYEAGAQRAEKCYEQMNPKPDIVLSLGEADCDLHLETQAHNLDDTPGFPDNAGMIRVNHVINANYRREELLTLPTAAMYCSGQAVIGPTQENSISPGFYVCNDVAFRFAHYLEPKGVPFSFIHVPEASCPAQPSDTAAKVTIMIEAAARELYARHGSTKGVQLSASFLHQTSYLKKLITRQCLGEVRDDLRKLHKNMK